MISQLSSGILPVDISPCLACEYEANCAAFTTIARTIVGPQPLHRVNNPSSLTIRDRALNTLVYPLLSAAGNLKIYRKQILRIKIFNSTATAGREGVPPFLVTDYHLAGFEFDNLGLDGIDIKLM